LYLKFTASALKTSGERYDPFLRSEARHNRTGFLSGPLGVLTEVRKLALQSLRSRARDLQCVFARVFS
jgi:hypothetical protein